jgi:hypothetical protein
MSKLADYFRRIVMEKEIKERLEEVVALLNDPEETVLEKEIKEKLEKILALLNNPEEIAVKRKKHKEDLKKVVALVNNAMVDPDIDIDYCIPGIETSLESCVESDDPYILVTYVVSEYTKPTRKIHLGDTAGLHGTPEEIANQITFL